MSRFLLTLLGLGLCAVIAMGFGLAFTQWHGMGPADSTAVLLLYAAATVLALAGFLGGQVMGVRSHAYYMVIAAALFLGVDVLVWLNYGLMPSVKFPRGGFVPAAILGVFLGPVYRVIAVPDLPMPRGP